MFDFLRARGEEFLTQISNELMGNPRFIRAMQTAMRGKEWVDQGVAQALRTLNVPTRTEFKRAVARIDILERDLAEARRQSAAAAARAAAPTARRRKPRKRAPAAASRAAKARATTARASKARAKARPGTAE